jgi:NhaA family Na+:H+ antiporter
LRLPRALREFLHAETGGGAALVAAAALALLWANSPWQGGYDQLWATELSLRLGRYGLAADLRHWVTDGLMTVFFLVVGLEIKRETAGRGAWRAVALPAVAAAGGMALPAAIYAAWNAGRPGAAGWGVPMATDVAFALAVLALLGRRVPAGLKVFLLTLAVVDDLGSVLVVAVVYHQGFDPVALLVAAAAVAAIWALGRVGVWWLPAHLVLGAALWLALRAAGISPPLAGVAIGLLTPVHLEGRRAHDLHPFSAFVAVPLFALANAGVHLGGGVLDEPGGAAVLAGILAGRLVGKPLGITAAAWLATRAGLGPLPRAVTWRQLAGVGMVAGVGFTVPLFVADLAFPAGRFAAAVRLGLLLATVAAGAAGALLLALSRPSGSGQARPAAGAPGRSAASGAGGAPGTGQS